MSLLQKSHKNSNLITYYLIITNFLFVVEQGNTQTSAEIAAKIPGSNAVWYSSLSNDCSRSGYKKYNIVIDFIDQNRVQYIPERGLESNRFRH